MGGACSPVCKERGVAGLTCSGGSVAGVGAVEGVIASQLAAPGPDTRGRAVCSVAALRGRERETKKVEGRKKGGERKRGRGTQREGEIEQGGRLYSEAQILSSCLGI